MRGRPRDGRGFTVIEVLVTVTLTGLVCAPLAGVLVQALRSMPDAGARTGAAFDRRLFDVAFNDDVAQATGVPVPETGAESTVACPALDAAAHVFLVTTTPAGAVQYQVTPVAARGTATRVRIERRAGGSTDPLLTGYCVPGAPAPTVTVTHADLDPIGPAPRFAKRRVRVVVRLAAAAGSAPTVVSFEASPRVDDPA